MLRYGRLSGTGIYIGEGETGEPLPTEHEAPFGEVKVGPERRRAGGRLRPV
jgi:hypothetical protein